MRKIKPLSAKERRVTEAMEMQGRKRILGQEVHFTVSRQRTAPLILVAAQDLREKPGVTSVMVAGKRGLVEKFQINESKRLLSPIDAWLKAFKG